MNDETTTQATVSGDRNDADEGRPIRTEKGRVVWPFEADKYVVPNLPRDGITCRVYKGSDVPALADILRTTREVMGEATDPRFFSSEDALALGATGESNKVRGTSICVIPMSDEWGDVPFNQRYISVRPAFCYEGLPAMRPVEKGDWLTVGLLKACDIATPFGGDGDSTDVALRVEKIKDEKALGEHAARGFYFSGEFEGKNESARDTLTVAKAHARWLICGEIGVVFTHGLQHERDAAARLKPDSREVYRAASIGMMMADSVIAPVRHLINERDDTRFACPFKDLMDSTENRWRVRNVFRAAMQMGRDAGKMAGRAALIGMVAGTSMLASPNRADAKVDGIDPYYSGSIDLSCFMRGGDLKDCAVRNAQRAGVRIDVDELIEGIRDKARERRETGDQDPADDHLYFAHGCENTSTEIDGALLTFTCNRWGEPSHILAQLPRPADGISLEYTDEYGDVMGISGGDMWRQVTPDTFINDDPAVLRWVIKDIPEQGVAINVDRW